MPWPRFLQLLGLVAFVAAPWGHGLDTHRFWEATSTSQKGSKRLWRQALMMGSVPVVLSSPLDVLYKQRPGDISKYFKYISLHFKSFPYVQSTSIRKGSRRSSSATGPRRLTPPGAGGARSSTAGAANPSRHSTSTY